jgi:hypothetical protein
VIPKKENPLIFYQNIYSDFELVIRKILSSEAAEAFFNDHYKIKYQEIEYLFKIKEVQDEILDNIIFAPLFSGFYDGITEPANLTIIINSIPGKFPDESVPIYNRKILQFGKIVITAINEIMGRYLRRYYSLFYGKKICFNTNKNKDIYKGQEECFYVELNFLGIPHLNYITIRNALVVLFWAKFIKYPIVNNGEFNIDENILKIIVENNKTLFNFIKLDNKAGDDPSLLTIEEYLDLNTVKKIDFRIIHCYGPSEDAIYY